MQMACRVVSTGMALQGKQLVEKGPSELVPRRWCDMAAAMVQVEMVKDLATSEDHNGRWQSQGGSVPKLGRRGVLCMCPGRHRFAEGWSGTSVLMASSSPHLIACVVGPYELPMLLRLCRIVYYPNNPRAGTKAKSAFRSLKMEELRLRT